MKLNWSIVCQIISSAHAAAQRSNGSRLLNGKRPLKASKMWLINEFLFEFITKNNLFQSPNMNECSQYLFARLILQSRRELSLLIVTIFVHGHWTNFVQVQISFQKVKSTWTELYFSLRFIGVPITILIFYNLIILVCLEISLISESLWMKRITSKQLLPTAYLWFFFSITDYVKATSSDFGTSFHHPKLTLLPRLHQSDWKQLWFIVKSILTRFDFDYLWSLFSKCSNLTVIFELAALVQASSRAGWRHSS